MSTATGTIRKNLTTNAATSTPATVAASSPSSSFPAPFSLPTTNANYSQNVAARLRHFRSDWSDYAAANKLSTWPQDRQIATLLSALGPAVATIYTQHLSAGSGAASVATTDALLDALEQHLLGDAAKRMPRLKLAKQFRYEAEPYGRWLDRLCWYIDDGCGYGESRDDVLLDRIISGVRNDQLSDELCSMGAELTLATAMERVRREDRLAKVTSQRTKEIQEMACSKPKTAKPKPMAKTVAKPAEQPAKSVPKKAIAVAIPAKVASGTKENQPPKMASSKPKTDEPKPKAQTVAKPAKQAAAPVKVVPKQAMAVAIPVQSAQPAGAPSKPLTMSSGPVAAKAKAPGPPKSQAKMTQSAKQLPPAMDSRKMRSDLCYQCGEMGVAIPHLTTPSDCPGYGHLCRRCGKRGHMEFVCRNYGDGEWTTQRQRQDENFTDTSGFGFGTGGPRHGFPAGADGFPGSQEGFADGAGGFPGDIGGGGFGPGAYEGGFPQHGGYGGPHQIQQGGLNGYCGHGGVGGMRPNSIGIRNNYNPFRQGFGGQVGYNGYNGQGGYFPGQGGFQNQRGAEGGGGGHY